MEILVLRFFERMIAVLIGGMAIYLGFRLFLDVQVQARSDGKIVLPWDISIALTRVGPGVFFALFGTVAVGIALLRPLEIGATPEGKQTTSYASSAKLTDTSARADARALLRKDIAVLNSVPRLLRPGLAGYERDSIERGLRRVKLALMRPVWGDATEGWADYAAFEKWLQAGQPTPVPSGLTDAAVLFRQGQ